MYRVSQNPLHEGICAFPPVRAEVLASLALG